MAFLSDFSDFQNFSSISAWWVMTSSCSEALNRMAGPNVPAPALGFRRPP
jgi:hypothetical protein